MKWFLYTLLFYVVVIISSCKKESMVPAQVYSTLTSLKSQYAPDKRTRIFNITPYLSTTGLVLKGETQYPEAKAALISAIGSIPYIDSIEIVPSKNLGTELYGVITIPIANIRSLPAHSAELATQALCGTTLRLWNFRNGWVYCQTPDDYLGWLDVEAITPMDSIQFNLWLQSKKGIITTDQTYVLNTKSGLDIVTPLSEGSIVQLISKNDKRWVEIALADGRKGFVSADHIVDLDDWKQDKFKVPAASSILESAQKLLGRPYLWGGTSVNGMDCSGFTKTVFYRNGLLLPRDASQQVHVGKKLSVDTSFAGVQAGDLLFFGRAASDSLPEKITHVAIYMGDKKIIHASGMVKIESLQRGDSSFAENRLKTFVRATRPLDAPQENGIPFIKDVKWYK